MNKKTKRITVGLVSALCLLLVVALGFGVTGAWYRARRQATGVVELDQGIKLIVNNLNEKTVDGDTALTQANQLKGSFWVATDDAGTKVALQEGTEVSSTNPGTLVKDVIVPTIKADTGSTAFYAKAKLDITFKAYNGDRSDVTEPVYTLADLYVRTNTGSEEAPVYEYTTNVTMGDIFTNQLTFVADAWKASDNGYYVYVNGGADAAEITDASGEIAVLTTDTTKGTVNCDTVALKDWTNGEEWVEFGGPIFYLNDGTAVEIAKINFSILIEVIQSTNLTTEAKEAFVGNIA